MGADPAEEEQFGPYLVYERLGVGGMATVHRALERGGEGFERVVALKRLLPHLAEDASFIKSFVREAKLASLLNHVNIVQIYELGRVGTEYFISMEYIDGRDIRRVLRHARKVTGPPPIHITVGMMLQLCEALDYAHGKSDEDGHPLGLVHRDVSPSNLLITSAGHLKVIDFGIAKAQSSQLRTQTGRVKGKLAYMAPEAVSGSKDLDARSDLWAAGVILHELLTARPLFASKNEYQTLLKVQRGDIMPPSTFNQACPPELDAIVFKALARDPDERFCDAGEFRDELIKVRKHYQMLTGYRDLAAWLDWAFSLEMPAGFTGNTVEQTGTPVSSIRGKTPRPPRNRDEDEAVEMVWGGGELEGTSGPVVLDDIPDVSEKHLARPDVGGEDVIEDDIPTPPPGYARMPYGTDPNLEAALARGTEQPRRPSDRQPAQRNTAQGVAVPRPSEPRRDSVPPALRARDSRPPTTRTRDSVPPPIPSRARDSQPSVRPDLMVRTEPTGMPFVEPPLDDEGRFGPEEDAAETLVGLNRDDPTTQTELPRDDVELPPVPVVRFSQPLAVPAIDELPPASPTRTKPGFGAPGDQVSVLDSVRVQRKSKPPSNVTIGASMVARNKPMSRTWLVVAGLVVAGGAATGITLFATRGDDTVTSVQEPTPRVPTQTSGTVKFMTEPADAEIKIEGQLIHSGSPWSTELGAGIHQIEIHRTGFKAWLTSIELSAHETQTLRVVLEPLGTAGGEATLIVSTTPSGLDAVLDGQLLAQRTPIKVTIKVGPHTIAVRQGGVETWHQSLTAEASSDYEFNPVLTGERPTPRPRPAAPRPAPEPAAVATAPEPPKPDEPKPSHGAVSVPKPSLATTVAPVPEPAPVVPVPVPAPVQPPAPPPPPPPVAVAHAGAPAVVAPNAVTKLSGDPPNIAKFKTTDLPPVLAAKVCIDASGGVTSVDLVTKIEHHAATDLADALKSWRYAPYKKDGAAMAACFSVTLRVK